MTTAAYNGVTGEYEYSAHLISEVSRSLGRDTFVFWPSVPAYLLVGKRTTCCSEGICCQSQLCPGVNQSLTRMTSAGMHRWLRIVDPLIPDAELRPVAMTKFDILKYVLTPTADGIPGSDASPLHPGDYGLFRPCFIVCDGCYL
jgi:hypothetical protein